MPTEMEDYLFDLRGYLVLEQALSIDRLTPERRAFMNV